MLEAYHDERSHGEDTESIDSNDNVKTTTGIVGSFSRRTCKSLIRLASAAYLRFLEGECAAYVQLLLHDSPLWRTTRESLFKALKNHLKLTFKKYAKEYEVDMKCRGEKGKEQASTLASRHRLRTGFIRGMLMDEVLSGRFPTDSRRNSYRTNDPNNFRGLHGNEHRDGGADDDFTGNIMKCYRRRRMPLYCKEYPWYLKIYLFQLNIFSQRSRVIKTSWTEVWVGVLFRWISC